MIPFNNGGSGNDGTTSVSVDKYTVNDIYYNYNKFSVVKIPTNDNSIKFLYTSQVEKDNKTNKFVLTYVEFSIITDVIKYFEMSIEDCGLPVVSIPSCLVLVDNNKNITNSINDLRINLTNENTNGKELLFNKLIFEHGFSRNSQLRLNNCLGNLNTIIINDDIDTIELKSIPNLKFVSPLTAKFIEINGCPYLKSIEIKESENVKIINNNRLENILIHKADEVELEQLTHLKTCIGINVKYLKIKSNITNEDILYDRWVRLFDFKNTEHITFEGTGEIRLEKAYFNSLDISQCTGVQTFHHIWIQCLYIPHIFYISNNLYYPIFPTDRDQTYIQVLNFTNRNYYDYFDEDDAKYTSKYEWKCVDTIYFMNFFQDSSNNTVLKRVLRHLFTGTQSNDLYLFTTKLIPANTLN